MKPKTYYVVRDSLLTGRIRRVSGIIDENNLVAGDSVFVRGEWFSTEIEALEKLEEIRLGEIERLSKMKVLDEAYVVGENGCVCKKSGTFFQSDYGEYSFRDTSGMVYEPNLWDGNLKGAVGKAITRLNITMKGHTDALNSLRGIMKKLIEMEGEL